MSETVLDASAVLAAVLKEAGGARVAELTGSILVSAVNHAEVWTRLLDLNVERSAAETSIGMLGIEIVAFDAAQAESAAALRAQTRSAGLSLGDRACLALAISRGAPAMTADRTWSTIELPVQVELVR